MYMCLTDGQHSNLKIDMMMNDKLTNSTPKLYVHVINDLYSYQLWFSLSLLVKHAPGEEYHDSPIHAIGLLCIRHFHQSENVISIILNSL